MLPNGRSHTLPSAPKYFADVVAADNGQLAQRLQQHFDRSGIHAQRHVEVLTYRDAEFGGITNVLKSFYMGFVVACGSWNGRDLGDPDSIFVLIESSLHVQSLIRRYVTSK